MTGIYLPDNPVPNGKRTTMEVCMAASPDRVEANIDFYPHDRDFSIVPSLRGSIREEPACDH